MIAPLALTVALFAVQSQPPTPSPAIGSQAPQQQATPKKTGPDYSNSPIVAAIGQQQTQQPNQGATQQNQQPTLNWWDWFTTNGANWAIVALTLVLAVLGVLQWWAIRTTN